MTGGTGGVHRAGPPARLAQTFEHMGVVLRPHPRYALADIQQVDAGAAVLSDQVDMLDA